MRLECSIPVRHSRTRRAHHDRGETVAPTPVQRSVFLSGGREKSRWVKDVIPLAHGAEEVRLAGKEGRSDRIQARDRPAPSPGVELPVVKHLGRNRRCRWLPRAPPSQTGAWGRRDGKRIGMPREVEDQRLDQRWKMLLSEPRSDQVIAGGPGGSRRTESVDHEEHQCPSPQPRQSLKVT
jgi:hypothetical protein